MPSSTCDPGSCQSLSMTRGRGRWPSYRDFRKLGWFSCARHSEKSVFDLQRHIDVSLTFDLIQYSRSVLLSHLTILQDSPNQCPMPINADQNHDIDLKCLSMLIIADQNWEEWIRIDRNWSTFGSMPGFCSVLGIDRGSPDSNSYREQGLLHQKE